MAGIESVLPHLPALRRYAFALAGSRESGDALVRACLEALIATPEALRVAEPRIALYALFHEVNGVPPLNVPLRGGAAGDPETCLFLQVGALEGEARSALTLSRVMGMPLEDVAAILGRGVAEMRRTLGEARRQLARLADARVLIIEDDYLLAQEIAQLVENMGQQVSGPAATYQEAMACAAEQPPTLVLADVQLRDGRTAGLLAGHALARVHQVPLILITAYPERLIQGPDVKPVQVFTKPFNHASLRSAISSSLATAPLAA